MSIGFFGAEHALRARHDSRTIPNADCYQQWEARKAEGDAPRFAGQERYYPVKGHSEKFFDKRGRPGRPRAKALGADRSGLDLRDALPNSAQTGADLLGDLRA